MQTEKENTINKERVTELLKKLDIEIGSTIAFSNKEDKVLQNMKMANIVLSKLKTELDIEF